MVPLESCYTLYELLWDSVICRIFLNMKII